MGVHCSGRKLPLRPVKHHQVAQKSRLRPGLGIKYKVLNKRNSLFVYNNLHFPLDILQTTELSSENTKSTYQLYNNLTNYSQS